MMEVPNTFFDLFLGYTAVWAILAVFMLRMTASQSKLHREMTALRSRLENSGQSGPLPVRAAK